MSYEAKLERNGSDGKTDQFFSQATIIIPPIVRPKSRGSVHAALRSTGLAKLTRTTLYARMTKKYADFVQFSV